MKVYHIFCFLFCTLSLSVSAQDNSDDTEAIYPTKGDHELSVSLGLYTSNITEDGFGTLEGTNYLRKLGAAISYDAYLSKTWSIKGRLNYDPKGFKTFFYNLNVNYITVAGMANWHFGKRKRWYLQFGPYIGYNISESTDPAIINFEGVKSTDFGLNLGIGVKIPIGGQMFYLESDGQTPFVEPFSDDGTDAREIIVRNSLSIGILF